MSKISKRPTVRMPSAQEDKAITAAAKSDPDAQPLTPTQLKAMVPLKSLRGCSDRSIHQAHCKQA